YQDSNAANSRAPAARTSLVIGGAAAATSPLARARSDGPTLPASLACRDAEECAALVGAEAPLRIDGAERRGADVAAGLADLQRADAQPRPLQRELAHQLAQRGQLRHERERPGLLRAAREA